MNKELIKLAKSQRTYLFDKVAEHLESHVSHNSENYFARREYNLIEKMQERQQ